MKNGIRGITLLSLLAGVILGVWAYAQGREETPILEGLPIVMEVQTPEWTNSNTIILRLQTRPLAISSSGDSWLMNDQKYPGELGQRNGTTWIRVREGETISLFSGHVRGAVPALPALAGEFRHWKARHPEVKMVGQGQIVGEWRDGQFVSLDYINQKLPPLNERDFTAVVWPTTIQYWVEFSGLNLAELTLLPPTVEGIVYRVLVDQTPPPEEDKQ